MPQMQRRGLGALDPTLTKVHVKLPVIEWPYRAVRQRGQSMVLAHSCGSRMVVRDPGEGQGDHGDLEGARPHVESTAGGRSNDARACSQSEQPPTRRPTSPAVPRRPASAPGFSQIARPSSRASMPSYPTVGVPRVDCGAAASAHTGASQSTGPATMTTRTASCATATPPAALASPRQRPHCGLAAQGADELAVASTSRAVNGQLHNQAARPRRCDGRPGLLCGVTVCSYSAAMASPARFSDPQPTTALLSAHTPRAIRDALIGTERTEFEHRYGEEMARAARTLDLTGVLEVIETFRKIAEITQRQGVEAHRVMLDRAARLQGGEQVHTVSGHIHKAEIRARLSR